MKVKLLHGWVRNTADAIAIQRQLAKKVSVKNHIHPAGVRFIAGADAALDDKRGCGIAGIIVFSYPEMEVVEKECARRKIHFPYIPGLLSFREAPVILDAVRKLKIIPDLFVFDGQGIAHPRSFGIASHLGLILDKPSIGCAKSRLIGTFKEPKNSSGSYETLLVNGKPAGAVVRTRDGVHPVYVSPGHKIDIKTSVRMILRFCDGTRIPKPTREADRYVRELKKQEGL